MISHRPRRNSTRQTTETVVARLRAASELVELIGHQSRLNISEASTNERNFIDWDLRIVDDPFWRCNGIISIPSKRYLHKLTLSGDLRA
jgi:hypothetical protein